MSFLNAALIAGVGLAGVPFLIHLLNRRRYRETIWAAMAFLQAAVKRHATRMRLEDVLLMALRMLVVALVALAVARPTLTGRWTGLVGLARRSSTAAIILLDSSYSMGAMRGGETRFDRARNTAREIVRTLPRGASSAAAVLLVNDRVEPIVGQLNHDLNAVDRALARARLSDGGTDLVAALTLVRDTLLPQVKAARTEVHILTDGQSRPWTQGGLPLADLLAEVASQATVTIETFPPAGTENLAVTAVGGPDLTGADHTTRDVLPSVHTACTVRATVRHFGRQAIEALPVDLWLDDRVVDQQVIPRLEAGGRQRVVFRFRVASPGTHRVRAVVVPGPTDRLPADNTRFHSLFVYDQIRVLVVDGDPRPGPFESESDYLRLALSPVDLDDPDAPFLITTDVCTLEEVEGMRLAEYAIVAFANVAGVSQALAERLARFVTDGGGFVLFLGDRVDLRDYNDVLFAGGKSLLPARLTALVGDPNDRERTVGVAAGGLTHYLVNHYKPTDTTLDQIRVHAAIDTDPAGVPDTEVVLRYTDGRPFVLTRRVGLGHVILVTTTADADWANLPVVHALLPLMQRSVNYLVYGQHAPDRLNLGLGRPFLFSLRPDQARLEVTITDPDGSPRAFPGAAGRRRIEWTDTWRVGFYRIAMTAERAGVRGQGSGIRDQDYEGRAPGPTPDARPLIPDSCFFSVNLDTAESDLTAIDENGLRRLLPNVPFALVRDPGAGLAAHLRRERIGTEVWPYVIGLVLLLLVAEGFLARTLSLRGLDAPG